jgi:hypothetical protein
VALPNEAVELTRVFEILAVFPFVFPVIPTVAVEVQLYVVPATLEDKLIVTKELEQLGFAVAKVATAMGDGLTVIV